MPLINFYAKWIQSKCSKSFGCSYWYHRSFYSFTETRDQKAVKCLSECATADTAVPAFQSFPWRTAQLQSFLCLALRKGRGLTSATQVLCRLRNEGYIMCFKGRGFHKQNDNKTPSQLPWKTNKTQTKPNKKQTKKMVSGQEVFGNAVTQILQEFNSSPESALGRRELQASFILSFPICTGAEIADEG